MQDVTVAKSQCFTVGTVTIGVKWWTALIRWKPNWNVRGFTKLRQNQISERNFWHMQRVWTRNLICLKLWNGSCLLTQRKTAELPKGKDLSVKSMPIIRLKNEGKCLKYLSRRLAENALPTISKELSEVTVWKILQLLKLPQETVWILKFRIQKQTQRRSS